MKKYKNTNIRFLLVAISISISTPALAESCANLTGKYLVPSVCSQSDYFDAPDGTILVPGENTTSFGAISTNTRLEIQQTGCRISIIYDDLGFRPTRVTLNEKYDLTWSEFGVRVKSTGYESFGRHSTSWEFILKDANQLVIKNQLRSRHLGSDNLNVTQVCELNKIPSDQ